MLKLYCSSTALHIYKFTLVDILWFSDQSKKEEDKASTGHPREAGSY